MAKRQTLFFFCSGCGFESPKWLGRCPACDAWNSFEEAPRAPKTLSGSDRRGSDRRPDAVRLADVDGTAAHRIPTGMSDLDQVLGGGIVPGAVLLLAGSPGVGKSTLALSLLHALARDHRVLYCCAEESAAQTKLRAARVGASSEIMLIADADVESVIASAQTVRPALLVVDSIQAVGLSSVEGAPGSVAQVRECAQALTRYAKESGCAIILVGHVTKDGAIAGPKLLEHVVDTVLSFEGERLGVHRLLRATKNRFGTTDGVCVFAMVDGGLREVGNPSSVFLSERPSATPGSTVVATMQGARPLLVEVQALVSSAGYGTPRRLVSGLDYNRVCMIVAVLERRLGMELGSHDVYANVVGGLKVAEPAADLGVALAIASAFRNRPVPDEFVCFGEIGLGGELRAVAGADRRLAESAKLGFKVAVMPNGSGLRAPAGGLVCKTVRTLGEAVATALD